MRVELRRSPPARAEGETHLSIAMLPMSCIVKRTIEEERPNCGFFFSFQFSGRLVLHFPLQNCKLLLFGHQVERQVLTCVARRSCGQHEAKLQGT